MTAAEAREVAHKYCDDSELNDKKLEALLGMIQRHASQGDFTLTCHRNHVPPAARSWLEKNGYSVRALSDWQVFISWEECKK